MIDASPSSVWAALTDFADYPAWNPFLRRLDAELRPGSPLRLVGRLPSGLSLGFTGEITRVVTEQRLAWTARPTVMPRRLLAVAHVFELDRGDPGGVRVRQYEDVTGQLLPVSGWMLRQVVQAQEQMLAALAERVQQA